MTDYVVFDGQAIPVGNPSVGGTLVPSFVTSLRSLVASAGRQTVTCDGYSSVNDGGGGTFVWNSADNRADDGGTIIKVTTVTNGRWNRVFRGAIDSRWYGVKADGSTDDTAALQNAVTQCAAVYGGGTVLVPQTGPAGSKWTVLTDTINVPSNVIIEGSDAPIRSVIRFTTAVDGKKIFSFNNGGGVLIGNVGLRNLYITSDNSGVKTETIYIQDCVYGTFEELTLAGTTGLDERNIAIHLRATNASLIPTMGFISFRNITVNGNEGAGGWVGEQSIAILIDSTGGASVGGGGSLITFDGYGDIEGRGSGLQATGATGIRMNNWTISGGAHSSTPAGPATKPGTSFNLSNCQDNRFVDCQFQHGPTPPLLGYIDAGCVANVFRRCSFLSSTGGLAFTTAITDLGANTIWEGGGTVLGAPLTYVQTGPAQPGSPAPIGTVFGLTTGDPYALGANPGTLAWYNPANTTWQNIDANHPFSGWFNGVLTVPGGGTTALSATATGIFVQSSIWTQNHGVVIRAENPAVSQWQLGQRPDNSAIMSIHALNALAGSPDGNNFVLASIPSAGGYAYLNSPTADGSIFFGNHGTITAEAVATAWKFDQPLQGRSANTPFAFSQSAPASLGGAGPITYTLSATENNTPFLKFTGTITGGDATVVFANAAGLWFVDVSGLALGGHNLLFKSGSTTKTITVLPTGGLVTVVTRGVNTIVVSGNL